jgi:CheY-like chemotaxis protein
MLFAAALTGSRQHPLKFARPGAAGNRVFTPKPQHEVARLDRCAILGQNLLTIKEPMPNGEFILLVEDDPNDVLLIQRAFRKTGLANALKVVSNGDEAIDYLRGNAPYDNREQFPLPYLMLLDLKMPGTDGFEVLRWARGEPELKRLLIVVLTSSNLQADVDRAYELGANSYLVKPVEYDEMANLIQRFDAYWTEINRIPSAPTLGDTTPRETSLI